jgi:hypothetical protein
VSQIRHYAECHYADCRYAECHGIREIGRQALWRNTQRHRTILKFPVIVIQGGERDSASSNFQRVGT